MAIETTYGQARSAYAAIMALSRMNLQIPLSAALRWKRIAGLLRPLEEQAAELEREIGDRYMERDAAGQPKPDPMGRLQVQPDKIAAYNKEIAAVGKEPITVGSDLVKITDLGADMEGTIGSSVVGYLEMLGPFLEDTPAG